jgi:hypothetical protein
VCPLRSKFESREVDEGVGISRSSQLPQPDSLLLTTSTISSNPRGDLTRRPPTWPKDDRIPDHDIIRLRSPRDPSRRVGLESSEISDETSSCGRRLCSPGGIKSRSKSGRVQTDKWRFGHGQCGLLGIVVIVMDLQDHSCGQAYHVDEVYF